MAWFLGSSFEGGLQNFQILEGFLEKYSESDMWGKISGFFLQSALGLMWNASSGVGDEKFHDIH